MLRSNLLVALAELERPTVIVTSATGGEGKTTVCANLALALAGAGLRVVAVDVDLRHPSLHTWLGAHNEVGLSDVLLQRADLETALQFIPSEGRGQGLYLLPSGRPVEDVTELLGSRRTARVLDSLASQADVLLLDTPPVLPVADTLVIGRMAAGAVLVVASRSTSLTSVERAKSVLTRNQTRILGVVLNKVQERDLAGSAYGFGYPAR